EITGVKIKKCEATDAECQFDFETLKATCVCKDESKVYVNGKCVGRCEKDDDCENGGSCTEQRTCKCHEGTNGDHCEEITGCEDLKCEATDAECQFDFEILKATCVCKDESQIYVEEKCVGKCEKDDNCENGGSCTEQRTCKCLEGTKGDHCEEITGCEDLKCEATDAECQFDFETHKATCVCRDKSRMYVEGKCVGV
ncbi:hypothetical protein TNIN_133051, partial [Trichonephila inaurata madagascariensis]